MVYGGAKGMKDFVVITLGTGLGSGIVINGKLVYGHDGLAGEVGHTLVCGGDMILQLRTSGVLGNIRLCHRNKAHRLRITRLGKYA